MFELNIKKSGSGINPSKLYYVYKYFTTLSVAYHITNSLWGFLVFIVIVSQCLSGIMLSFSLMNDCMLISLSREEEDSENNYIDDFFWIHERGVDILIITSFFHLLRKLYLGVNDIEQEYSWKTGVFSFLIIQITIFAGLVLCTTHLSEITLTIAVNALHTFFLFTGKSYWWFFTDKSLNTDTIIRMMYLHYCIAFFLLFLGLMHGVDMHYDWKAKGFFSGIKQQLNWWDEALSNELGLLVNFIVVLGCFGVFLYSEPEALSYEIFMWGDIGLITDIRFYGVAPHWYFRPYMAWLVVCPYHYTGIFGLVFFFLVLYFQVSLFGTSELENLKVNNNFTTLVHEVKNKPAIKAIYSWVLLKIVYWSNYLSNYLSTVVLTSISNTYLINLVEIFIKILDKIGKCNELLNKTKLNDGNYSNWNTINYDTSLQWLISFSLFFIAILYTLSFLPYGRFYNKLGGNFALLFSYLYIFSFLTFSFLRNSWILSNNKINTINV